MKLETLIDLLRLHTAIWKRTLQVSLLNIIKTNNCFVEYLLYPIACVLPHLRNFVNDDSSFFLTPHFSALEFGFQVSSHSVFVVPTRNGLFGYLVRTSMNFAHFVGFHALSFVDRINRSEKDRHFCRWDERIRRNPSQDAAVFTKSEHTIKQAVALSSPVSTVFARNAWVFTSSLPSFSQH